jgi:tetratricopeptide (TPR) repeat protein
MTENFSFDEIKQKFKSNKLFRISSIAGSAILLAVILFLGYRQFIWKPSNEKSKESYGIALNYIVKAQNNNNPADTIVSPIDPVKKLQSAVKKFDGKIGGEISKYLLATQYMRNAKFKEAKVLLEDISVDDTYMSAMVVGLQGDCASELKNYGGAIELYKEAAKINDNDFTSPMYLFKAGLNAEKLKKNKDATDLYEQIAFHYPNSFIAKQKNMEKYKSRSANKKLN